METDAIVSPPSSITSTIGSTLTDILQLSSSSSSSSTTTTTRSSPSFRSSRSSSPSSDPDDDEETERKVNRSSASSSDDDVHGHCCSDIGLNLGIGDDGLFILTPSDDPPKSVHQDTALTIDECKICYQELPITHRPCCDYVTCIDCLRQYFASQVEMGSMRIECINVQCHTPIDPSEIASHLDTKLRDIYLRLIQESNCNLTSKTCPACSTMYTLKSSQQLRTMKKRIKKDPSNSRVKCPECKYFWCFLCHAPWHQGLTCGQYRQGDRLLKVWAKQLSQGQLNAQRCPKCKTFIQKSGGCDHMHCNRCKTGFCYRCGEPLRRLKFFGDHYSKFSIFGCKYRYKKESPIQRKAIRGAVFASKLFLAPILGSLIFCAGTLFVSVAVAFLPFYGVITIYKKYSPN